MKRWERRRCLLWKSLAIAGAAAGSFSMAGDAGGRWWGYPFLVAGFGCFFVALKTFYEAQTVYRRR